MKKKNYCVHVFERPREYENIRAISALEAEKLVIDAQYAGDYDDIQQVEVMLQCNECGLDNDNENTKCEECGADI